MAKLKPFRLLNKFIASFFVGDRCESTLPELGAWLQKRISSSRTVEDVGACDAEAVKILMKHVKRASPLELGAFASEVDAAISTRKKELESEQFARASLYNIESSSPSRKLLNHIKLYGNNAQGTGQTTTLEEGKYVSLDGSKLLACGIATHMITSCWQNMRDNSIEASAIDIRTRELVIIKL